MEHDKRIETAKQALNKVFSDTSVDVETTIQSLQDLHDEIDIMLDALESNK